jgi:hypothetical protein
MRRKGLAIRGKSMLTVAISGQVAKPPTLSSRTMSVLAYINAENLFSHNDPGDKGPSSECSG